MCDGHRRKRRLTWMDVITLETRLRPGFSGLDPRQGLGGLLSPQQALRKVGTWWRHWTKIVISFASIGLILAGLTVSARMT
jgi:hypothetical protein